MASLEEFFGTVFGFDSLGISERMILKASFREDFGA
jgi:hypothetical protein